MAQNIPAVPSIPINTTILENIWIQYGALGLLILFLVLAVVFLYKMVQSTIKEFKEERIAKDEAHRKEWAKLKSEQKEEREIFDKKSEERVDLFVKVVTDSAAKFTRVLEGVVKENTQFLAENKAVLRNIGN